jgi:N-carbamoylputrescine amidase
VSSSRLKFGTIGTGICWDQWFPEAARVMTMLGAEVIIYPTAIGSEPAYPGTDSKPHWQQTMQGHAAANLVPIVAANRIGKESDGKDEIDFYGASFIADHHGQKVVETSSDQQEIQLAKFNLDDIENERLTWGVFRTRREDLYGSLSEPAPTSLLKKM